MKTKCVVNIVTISMNYKKYFQCLVKNLYKFHIIPSRNSKKRSINLNILYYSVIDLTDRPLASLADPDQVISFLEHG